LVANAGEENLAGVFFVQRIVHLAAGLCESGIAFLPTKTRKPEGASSVPLLMIAPKFEGRATPLCYASSEPLEA
jgi:hypothetical protein